MIRAQAGALKGAPVDQIVRVRRCSAFVPAKLTFRSKRRRKRQKRKLSRLLIYHHSHALHTLLGEIHDSEAGSKVIAKPVPS
jgi:hypothetical protein